MTKILLVEDNEVNREMIVRRLGRKGYTLLTAGDGEAAVRTANFERPDVILMDMDLPIMSGPEATSAIRKIPELAGIPIVALTAHAMAGDSEMALSAGFDDYVTKPIDFPTLLSKIEALVSTRPRSQNAGGEAS